MIEYKWEQHYALCARLYRCDDQAAGPVDREACVGKVIYRRETGEVTWHDPEWPLDRPVRNGYTDMEIAKMDCFNAAIQAYGEPDKVPV